MYFKRKCKITFISHGATIYTEEGRISDALNYPPLSELGVEEMENMAGYLKARGVKNDVIYSSPSVRTCQSAMMVAKVFKKDYEQIEDLTTRKFASLNGLTLDQIGQKYPSLYKFESDNSARLAIEGLEGRSDFINRVKNVIDDIVEKNIGNRIIIVTYPEVIQAAICAALGLDESKLHKIYIRTGSATQISYFEGWASLVYSGYVPL